MLSSYKELKVWQKAYQLCLEIYKMTRAFPKEEQYNLTDQEGCGVHPLQHRRGIRPKHNAKLHPVSSHRLWINL
jgi:hypothetical protein